MKSIAERREGGKEHSLFSSGDEMFFRCCSSEVLCCIGHTHLFRLLLDRSSCPLVFVLGHRETEQLLDTVVVRLPRRRVFLSRRPHGVTICVYLRGKEGYLSCAHTTSFCIISYNFFQRVNLRLPLTPFEWLTHSPVTHRSFCQLSFFILWVGHRPALEGAEQPKNWLV